MAVTSGVEYKTAPVAVVCGRLFHKGYRIGITVVSRAKRKSECAMKSTVNPAKPAGSKLFRLAVVSKK